MGGCPGQGRRRVHRSLAGLLLLLVPLALAAQPACDAAGGYGPFRIDAQSPFQSLRLSLLPRTPQVLSRGRGAFATGASLMNIWSVHKAGDLPGSYGDYYLDHEALHSWADLRLGLGGGFEGTLRLGSRNRFPGRSDALVDAFHRVTGLRDGGRPNAPRNRFTFRLHPDSGTEVVLEGGGNYSREVEFELARQLLCGARGPALLLALRLAHRIDDQGDLQGDATDAGLSLALARRWGRAHGYFNLGWFTFGADRFRGLELRPSQFAGLLALEWRALDRHALIFQWLFSEGATADFGPYAQPAHELNFGWKGELVPGLVLQLAGFENFVHLDNSPDIGISLLLALRW